jgi:hypothetical protein
MNGYRYWKEFPIYTVEEISKFCPLVMLALSISLRCLIFLKQKMGKGMWVQERMQFVLENMPLVPTP